MRTVVTASSDLTCFVQTIRRRWPNPFNHRDRARVHMNLTGKQRRHLRALGHHLDPLVQLGKLGLTDGIIAAVDAALEQHELVKVRIGTECPEDRHDVAERLPPLVRAELGQVLGRTLLLYRRHPKEPKISLPKA